MIIAIDLETFPITKDAPAPCPVCVSWARDEKEDGNIVSGVGSVLALRNYVPLWLANDHVAGHNIAYDLSCLYYNYGWGDVIFKALDEGRIHDTLLREKLLDLQRCGSFQADPNTHKPLRYGLADLEKKYLNIDRSGDKAPDGIREHFGELADIPLEEWPKEFLEYSKLDAVNCLRIYKSQEMAAQRRNLVVETEKVRAGFALRLIECTGMRQDPDRVKAITAEYKTAYQDPDLTQSLVDAGFIIPATPPQPYANGARQHVAGCNNQPCDCPVKMTKGKPETCPRAPLFDYIWQAAGAFGSEIEAWPAPKEAKTIDPELLDGRGFTDAALREERRWNLKVDEEWIARFADKDPLLAKWAKRKSLQKIVTDYLPKLYDGEEPAEIIRASYQPLCLTGRSSSFASKHFPSRNGQNVDPRVRECCIPRDGNVFVSTDYSAMELGTLAQRAFELFGYSVLRDKINEGVDTHAYLGAQIAYALDRHFSSACADRNLRSNNQIAEAFMSCKGSDRGFRGDDFKRQYREKYLQEHNKPLDREVTWGDFYKYYRTMAKPTGLGFPGGLGASTMVQYAKATYKVDLDEQTARTIREIWKETYPELAEYLEWVSREARDSGWYLEFEDGFATAFYTYTTPRGMVRRRCTFCEAANGGALQASSAEGALRALYQVSKQSNAGTHKLLRRVLVVNFIHDEILWEYPECDDLTEAVKQVEKIMVAAQKIQTPDVAVRTESAAMRRWYKQAESVYNDGMIQIWEPTLPTT